MANEMEKDKIEELGRRMLDCEPLQDDPGFDLSQQTLRRYLVASDWNLNAAEKLIRGTMAYRRSHRPQDVECKWCLAHPGYHSIVLIPDIERCAIFDRSNDEIQCQTCQKWNYNLSEMCSFPDSALSYSDDCDRQIGFDRQGRPVIYSSFTQVWTHHNHVDDSIAHFVYLLENVQRCMNKDVYQLVYILDVSGLTMSACNPRLAYGVSQVLSNHYPERLGLAYVINHSAVMHALWKACAVVVPAVTVKKTHVIRGKHNIEEAFSAVFPDELKNWIYEETRLNKLHPIPESQKTFWKRPADGVTHDPRGCPSYVRDYIDRFSIDEYKKNRHTCKPHPNILDTIIHPAVVADNDLSLNHDSD